MSLALFSCDKDEEQLILRPGAVPALTASATSVELLAENKTENAVTLNWSAAEYGYSAAVKYTLQFITEGGDFDAARNVEVAAGTLSKTMTVAELNTIASQLGMAPNSESTMQIRVMAEIAPSVEPAYSNAVNLNVTPFLDIIEYASLWVPGSHQGWNPGTAPKVASVQDNGVYEGYVYFPDATNEFKINPAPNWDNDFGGTSTNNAGTLVPKSDNLQVNGAGYYLLKANTNQLTWSATRTSWGVIGDATANGWDSDQDLTYDATEQAWKATLQLKAGEIKFRANDAWDINMGDDDANGLLGYGAANIVIAEAGQYLVILDLSNAGNYTYSVIKQ